MASTTNRIRYWEVWEDVMAHLQASARLIQVLQGGKIYLEGSDYSQPEGAENKAWGRLVLVPVTNPWLDKVGIGATRSLRFLTRAEVHSNNAPGFNPQKTLDAIQDECMVQLEGYVIPIKQYAMGALPLWLARPQQQIPLWDKDRSLYFTSAEWRGELAAP